MYLSFGLAEVRSRCHLFDRPDHRELLGLRRERRLRAVDADLWLKQLLQQRQLHQQVEHWQLQQQRAVLKR
jgi:hypothetical protein